MCISWFSWGYLLKLPNSNYMKTIITLAFTVLLFAGCTKQNDTELNAAVGATVEFMGSPQQDGLGWVLMIDGKVEIPTNLPEEFKVQSLAVLVVYKRADRTFPCRCITPPVMIDIISISRVNGG